MTSTYRLPIDRRSCLIALPVLLSGTFSGTSAVSATQNGRVTQAATALNTAITRNDIDARLSLYSNDVVGLHEHQSTLYGRDQMAIYLRAMTQRREVTRFEVTTSEQIDLGDAVMEVLTFQTAWTNADGTQDRHGGKSIRVWHFEGTTTRLKGEVIGYFDRLKDPSAHYLAIPSTRPLDRPLTPDRQAIADRLDAQNRINAEGVRTRDLAKRTQFFTDETVIMPFADTPKAGLGVIVPYIDAYIRNGSGVALDPVNVWTDGFEAHGDHVIEYSRFRVIWRSVDPARPPSEGEVTGGGIRLWKRRTEGDWTLLREGGTHFHIP